MLCASSLAQKAAVEALARKADVDTMIDEYRRRRNFIASSFRRHGARRMTIARSARSMAFPSVAKFKLPATKS